MKRKLSIAVFALAVSILLVLSSAQAHPHLFLTNKLKVVFDSEGIAGFNVEWAADEFSSIGLTDGYDENESGKLDPDELRQFEKDSFTNLRGFNYFTHITIDKKPFKVSFVKEFRVTYVKGKINYTFFIPCHIKAYSEIKEVSVAQYDSSYFSYIAFSETAPVVLENGKKFTTEFTISENKAESYYFDMIHPVALILRFKE